jgi:Leucine-rich repeat (LRR) protein
MFSDLPITDLALRYLEQFPDLTSLHIMNCPVVTDAGLRHLKSLKKLRRLDLRGSSITDSGLAELSGLSELRELALSRTSVSDAGLEHLEGLAKLEWLTLSNTAVTRDGAKALKQHLPKCAMSW